MYELSQVISNHQRDLRCLDYYRNTLITGGSDKVFNLYTYSHGHLTLITKFDAFEKNILSVRLNKVNESEVCALVGCMDGNTYAIDHNGSPLYTYPHESAISSIDFIDDNHFVAGSWDGKAIVW